ncbi:MAG: hypothetical protein COZ32_02065 [Nitrospirae bacterium CG_4_10_14_3_um_filter_53_41]|nr:MAG: hypothetical protein AUK29_01335 [Nitrospirae bacterium CG2_30_53_67]PIX86684.1 MAG: hypothetical protein COZ32_02065 [Nitrospirae bacterium CG_4_10_14_3_um_filter_53_41]
MVCPKNYLNDFNLPYPMPYCQVQISIFDGNNAQHRDPFLRPAFFLLDFSGSHGYDFKPD